MAELLQVSEEVTVDVLLQCCFLLYIDVQVFFEQLRTDVVGCISCFAFSPGAKYPNGLSTRELLLMNHLLERNHAAHLSLLIWPRPVPPSSCLNGWFNLLR